MNSVLLRHDQHKLSLKCGYGSPLLLRLCNHARLHKLSQECGHGWPLFLPPCNRAQLQAFPKVRPRMATSSSALQSRTIASFPKSAATDGRFFFGSAITDDCKS
jgi:hypothetical protein